MATPRPPLDTGQPLANLRHERFAQLVVSGLPQSRAYIEAGYNVSPTSAEQAASRLVKADVKVTARIAELRAPTRAVIQVQAEAATASAAWIVEQTMKVVRMAFDQERPGIATPALALLAKMHPATFAPDGQINLTTQILIAAEGKLTGSTVIPERAKGGE